MILTRDDTFRVVFNLRTPIAAMQESTGTGVFVVRHDRDIFMVTATHVARTCSNSTNVVISDASGNATSLRLTDFNANLSWKHHPIGDISVLPIYMTQAIQPHLSQRFLPLDHFHLEHIPVSRDYELTSVGFPHGLGTQGMFCPLTYRSYASSAFITLNRFDINTPSEFFLLENL